MTRKGDFVLRQIADEYVLIPYGATAEKMNQVLTLSETAAFIYEQTGDAASAEEIAERLGKAYDVPAEEVQEDVNAVLETFRNYGILESVRKIYENGEVAYDSIFSRRREQTDGCSDHQNGKRRT